MEKVYIHIGLHKTASTFFQKYIFPNFDNITFISRPYTQLNHAFNKLQFADDSLYRENEFISEINKFKGRNLLISDEMLSGQPFFNYMNRSIIAQRLKKAFPEATILIFLRNQTDIIFSLYNTWIRAISGTKKIENAIWYPSKNYDYEQYARNPNPELWSEKSSYYFYHDDFSIHLDGFLYFELISYYKLLFKNVHVFLYEDFKNSPDKFVKEIEDVVGEKILNFDSINLSKPVLESIDNANLEALRIKNSLKQIVGNKTLLKITENVTKLFLSEKKLSKNTSYISHELIHDFYKENNRKLLEKYPEIRINFYPKKYQF